MVDPAELLPNTERGAVADIIEVVWLPALLALITAASTWLIWYYTHTVCTPEVAALTGCNPGSVARYVNVDVFGRMLTYGGLVGGIGGFWRYDMIKKERAARIAAQNQAVELRKQLQEERVENAARREEERLRREEEQQLREEERQRREEERQRQWAEERQFMMQQAAEDRRAFLSVLTELTAEIAHLRQQRNGNGQSGQ